MNVHPHCCQAASISLLPAHSASDGWLRRRRTFSIASCRTFSTNGGVARVHAAGEHEVLPDQQTRARRRSRRSGRLRRSRRPRRGPCSCWRSAADPSSARYFSSPTRVTKLSAGIQLAPFMKTGAPLTTTVKLLPAASCRFTTSSVRSPTRVCRRPRTTPPDRQRRLQRVELLRAEAVRPPALGLVDRDLQRGSRCARARAACRPCRASRRPGAPTVTCARPGARRHDHRGDLQPRPRVVERPLIDLHVVEPRLVPGLDRRRPPDPAGHEARPPVPPVVVGGLAREHRDHLLGLIVRRRQRVAEPVVERLGHRDRRPEADDDRCWSPATTCGLMSARQVRNMLSASSTRAPLTDTSA